MNEYDFLAKAKDNMEEEKYHEVISLCNKALKINEDLPEAYEFRGNAKYELGKYDDALEDFDELIKREPDNANHYYDRSWAYCKIYDCENAIIDISKALEIKPNTSLYYYDKARFEYWSGRNKEAIFDITKGIELRPTENKYLLRGYCYFELEMYNEALADYNFAIEINPECAVAYYRRGLLYKKLDRLDIAEKDFKKAIELNPKYDDAMIELGLVRIQLGKKDAMTYFNKAIKVNPCADNYYWRVKARQKILIREDSLKKLAEGKLVEYDDDEIFNEKQAKDDIKDLSKAIALDPEDIYCLKLRVERYLYLKQYENALEDCEKLLELEPENYNWQRSTAYCKYCTDDFKGCIEGIDKYLEMNDICADDFLFQTRGHANYQLKNYKAAVNDYTKGLAFKETDELYYSRGLANYKLKHLILAHRDFKMALKINPELEKEDIFKIPFFAKMFLSKKKNNDAPIGLCQIKND